MPGMEDKPMEARYEFRVFGAELGNLHSALRSAFALAGESSREDIYLLGNSAAHMFKLRGGTALDLKCLVERRGAFQRWSPAGLVDLPASGRELAGMFGGQGAAPSFDAGRMYDPRAVIAAFTDNGHCAVRVAKRRWQYEATCGKAEFAILTIGQSGTTDTVALEGQDADALEELRIRLGLKRYGNSSYFQFLTGEAPSSWQASW